jgi:O-antigen ligase/Tfp pilus assembly protein PilF
MPIVQGGLLMLILVSPLLTAPDFGYDGVRLPAQLLALALLMGLRAFSPPALPRPDPVLWAGLALLGAEVVSLGAAHSPLEGAFPLGVLLAGLLAYVLSRNGPPSLDAVTRALPWAIGAVGIAFSIAGWVGGSERRGLSTEGNRNYAGDLAGMLFAALLGFLFQPRPAWKRGILAVAAALLLVELYLSESRAGVVGAAGGCLVVAAVLRAKRSPRALAVPAAAVALLVGMTLAAQSGRQLSKERRETVSFRLEVWKSAGAMLLDRPLLGTGVGNFAVGYPAYRSDREFQLSNKYAPAGSFVELLDPHSSWVQVAVEPGLLGLLAFLLVVLALAREGSRAIRSASAPDPDRVAFLAGLGGGAAAYLSAGLFNTLSVHASHTVLFWIFAGLMGRGVPGEGPPPPRRPGLVHMGVCLAAAAVAAGVAWIDWGIARAERAINQANHASDALEKMGRLDRAIALFPEGWRAHFERGNVLSKMGRTPESIQAYRECLRWRPLHASTSNSLAVALLRTGQVEEGYALLLRAAQQVPSFPLTYYNLGTLEMARGRMAEAEVWYGRSLEHRPEHAPSHYSLGEVLLRRGDVPGALPHLRRATELGYDVGQALHRDFPEALRDSRLKEFFP